MSEHSLAAQRLAVATMRAHAPLTAMLPAGNIFDRSSRPEIFPCVLVGEGQTVGTDVDCLDSSDVYLDLHVWTAENGMVSCKSIAAEVRRSLRRKTGTQDGIRLAFKFEDATFLRDPDGEHSHGIVRFHVLAWETI